MLIQEGERGVAFPGTWCRLKLDSLVSRLEVAKEAYTSCVECGFLEKSNTYVLRMDVCYPYRDLPFL